jgi:hypothetical protein
MTLKWLILSLGKLDEWLGVVASVGKEKSKIRFRYWDGNNVTLCVLKGREDQKDALTNV